MSEHLTIEPLACQHGLPYWHPCSECGAMGLQPGPTQRYRNALERIAKGWSIDALDMQRIAQEALK